MNTSYRPLLRNPSRLIATCALLLSMATTVEAQTGQVQWVHASADTALAVVDVYLDGELLLDDFAYQTATPFESPIPGSHEVVIAPKNSTGVADSIATFAVGIADDTDYHLIIGGVADSEASRPNPDRRSTELSLFVISGALQASPDTDDFAIRQFYGVTDLAAMTWVAENTVLWQNMRYGDATDYTQGSPGTYTGHMRATGRAGSSLLQLEGHFDDLAGQSVLDVISGFFATPEGSGLQLFEVFADGSVVHVSDITQYTRLQFVQASPDSSFASIDMYIDGMLLLDDFEFRTATAFMNLPSGLHDLDIAPGISVNEDDAIKRLRPNFVSGDTSYAVLAGVLDPGAFLPNPDGRSVELNLHVTPGALEASDEPGYVAVRGFYGVPNLPAVSFFSGGTILEQNLRYGDFGDYSYPEPRDYVGSFRATGLATSNLWSGIGPFGEWPNEAVLSVFTGFFGVGSGITTIFVTADGSVMAQENIVPSIRAQFVHASADPALASVDVYFDGIPLLVDHTFASGTAFMDLPAAIHEVAIASGGSTGKNDAVETYRETYQENKTYSLVLAGVIEPDMFAPNPDGKDTGLNLFVADDALEQSTNPGEFSIRQFYGVINMPTSNFWIEEWDDALLFRNLGYGDFTDYTNGQNPGALTGAVRPVGASRNETPLIATVKDWGGNEGRSIFSVFAGYTYDEHPGGQTADIRAFYVLADGSTHPLQPSGTWTSTEDEVELPKMFAVSGNYPNPFNPTTNVTFDLPQPAEITIEVYDLAGRLMAATTPTNKPAGHGQSVRIDATAWSSGLYFYKVIARTGTSSWIGTGQMILLK